MKHRKAGIVRRFTVVIFSLITILGLFFIVITYMGITHYHQASTQLLNKDVAGHIAKFTSPLKESGFDKEKADSVFYNTMVLSPSAEVYFLDTSGKVIAFHADAKEINEWTIPLLPINRFIDSKGEKYIKGTDPRDGSHSKIFSAASVAGHRGKLGFIYVILGSKTSQGITDLLLNSHILNLAVIAFIAVIILSILFSLLYLKKVKKNFSQMITVLERFENGDYTARFNLKKHNDMEPITQVFNKMADLLSSSINKLTKSEQEIKNLIANISHDLRMPLSIARGYTETLMIRSKETTINKYEQEEYSQLIYSKILQIEKMVKQLFELSKMDAVEFTSCKEPFVLSEIVQETVNTFRLIAVEKKVSLECTQCMYHVWINADISMIESVVQNLIDNAMKNTFAGGSILVWLEVDKKDLIFNIQNSGPSLSDDLVQWINNSSDAKNLANGQPAKRGLGLRIVQKILHLHQTSLTCSSQNGFNTFTFRISIYHHSA